MIVAIAPLDEDYARNHLNSILRSKIRELDRAYSSMGPDSLPEIIKTTAALRQHYKGGHPVDMAFALSYEAADSLDKAVVYLENYLNSLEGKWRTTGPVARYLTEVKYRRDNRTNPRFYTVPRDSFRFVYRIQGFKKPPDFLDISSDGRSILHPGAPDSLDPRAHVSVTVPAQVDSPAVTFLLSTEEIDSLYRLFTHYDFMKFKLKYTEPCYQCGNTEMTLVTPWNRRTIHLMGEDLAKPPFRLEKSVSGLLNKYFQPLYYLRADWKEHSRYASLWSEYNTAGKSPDDRLDALIGLFNMEPVKSSWQNDERYIEPLVGLAEQARREAEVYGTIGLRYFNSVFKWKSYTRERLPDPNSPDLLKIRENLSVAAEKSEDKTWREWYEFLLYVTRNYSGPTGSLSEKVDRLTNRENQGNARFILLWLACARGDLEQARSLHAELSSSKIGKRLKFESSLRMMLYVKDQNLSGEALGYLEKIEEKYRGLLSDRRNRPIGELNEYSKVDLVLDRVQLDLKLGDLQEAERLVQSLDKSDIPDDRQDEYDNLLLIVSYHEIPSTYNTLDLKDYLRALHAMGQYGLRDLSAGWAIWLLDNLEEPKIRSQVISILRSSFQSREVWDELQANSARTLLTDFRADPSWKSIDLAERLLQKVIDHGSEEEVVRFWRDEIYPHPLKITRISTLDNLSTYFKEANFHDERGEVLRKIRKELVDVGTGTSISQLVMSKYTLDLAELYVMNLERRMEGIELVDSLANNLGNFEPDAYPYIFAAVAEWKGKHVGWDSLVDFVSPYGDSLIEAEKDLDWSIYRPHLIPDMPLSSPLLALRCISQDAGFQRLDRNFFDLLGLQRDQADSAIKGLKTSPQRLNLSCDQAQLLNWKEDSFEAILTQYDRRIR
jgi:hypothetical protein